MRPPLYCRTALGGTCRDGARAARLERRAWSMDARGRALERERRARREAARLSTCAHCGRDLRFGPRLEHRTFEDCERRYPALVSAVAWVLVGSGSEAACCIRDFRDRLRFGSECVSHSGLSPADRVLHAVRAWRDPYTRRALRSVYRARRDARALEAVL
jgi:hypothetical protein